MSKCNNSCHSSHQNETNPVFSTEWNILMGPTVSANITALSCIRAVIYHRQYVQQESIFTPVTAKLMSKFFNKNINFFLLVELHFATKFQIFNTTFCCKMRHIQVFCDKTQYRNLPHFVKGEWVSKQCKFFFW